MPKIDLDYGNSYLYDNAYIFIFLSFENIRFSQKPNQWEIAIQNGFDYIPFSEYVNKELSYIKQN